MNAFDQQRSKANQELSELLAQIIKENPSERFHQILRNYGFITEDRATGKTCWVNEFYLEPTEAVARVKEKMKEMQELRKQQNS